MVQIRAITVAVALACATAPTWVAAQRVVNSQTAAWRGGSNQFPRLRLVGTAPPPVRVSWRRSEVALAGGFTAALLIDAAQTRRLARAGWRDYTEANPILGPRPSVGQVNTYTAVVGLSILGVAAAAPKRARPWVLGVALAVEACTLAAMSREGIPIRIL